VALYGLVLGCTGWCDALAAVQGGPEGDPLGLAPVESATTDSESVSDIQLVRGGGEQRTLFKLTLQVSG
jgi:hypothetical protein